MAISKDDTVLTYSKFKEFWSSFATLFNKKLDGSGIKNNDTTTDEGYVLDARVGKVHGDEIDGLKDQLNGIYLATNSDGKWGYKTSKNGAVNPFRNPTGTATAGDVLVGKTFANASSDNQTGTMPNNGDVSKTVTPTGNNSATYVIPAGYTSGGTVTADGTTAYGVGYTEGESAGYTDGYAAGYAASENNKVGPISFGPVNTDTSRSVTITAGTINWSFSGKSFEKYTTTQYKITVNGGVYASGGWEDRNSHTASGSFTAPAGTMVIWIKGGMNQDMLWSKINVWR